MKLGLEASSVLSHRKEERMFYDAAVDWETRPVGTDVGEMKGLGHGPLHPAVVKEPLLRKSVHASPSAPLPRHGLLLCIREGYLPPSISHPQPTRKNKHHS